MNSHEFAICAVRPAVEVHGCEAGSHPAQARLYQDRGRGEEEEISHSPGEPASPPTEQEGVACRSTGTYGDEASDQERALLVGRAAHSSPERRDGLSGGYAGERSISCERVQARGREER